MIAYEGSKGLVLKLWTVIFADIRLKLSLFLDDLPKAFVTNLEWPCWRISGGGLY